MGGRGASSGKKTFDTTYEVKTEFVGKKNKQGKFSMGLKSESAGFKAVYLAPVGTKITAHYKPGFGDTTLSPTIRYEVIGGGSKGKRLVAYKPDGTTMWHHAKSLGSISQAKKLLGHPVSITIHALKK